MDGSLRGMNSESKKDLLNLKPKIDQMKQFILLEVGSGFLPLQMFRKMTSGMLTKKI